MAGDLEISQLAADAVATVKKKTLSADGQRWGSRAVSAMLAAVAITAPLLVIILGGGIGAPAVWIKTAMAGLGQGSSHVDFPLDKLHGGLLVEGFDQGSCRSRYQAAMYRRNPGKQPSKYLVSKLRRQEALQRRCGPGTAAYSSALEQLKSGKKAAASPECKYLVSVSYRGLGNRLLAAASAFLYAMLTDRTLLVDPDARMDELFCEPFLNSTWLLPKDFPLWGFRSFYLDTPERYGKMRESGGVLATTPEEQELPAFAYIHLDHNQTDQDKLFFCDEDQRLLSGFQWLVLRTDQYIVPGMFLVQAFQEELAMMFPEPDTVFHHLGRYLFHPSNHVWGLITRFYHAHRLASARRLVGIQVRVFPWEPNAPDLLEWITTCTQKEAGMLPRLLPLTEQDQPPARGDKSTTTTIAVVMTSLKSWYSEQLQGMYWENATATGELVVVHQPSHEERQRYGDSSHEHKAWAEIYLLSLMDALVTTATSTFGYTAQGLAGLTPWVLPRPDQPRTGVACYRAMSMEPCCHVAPMYDCKRPRVDSGKVVPHVQHCDDSPEGLKLVNRKEW